MRLSARVVLVLVNATFWTKVVLVLVYATFWTFLQIVLHLGQLTTLVLVTLPPLLMVAVISRRGFR